MPSAPHLERHFEASETVRDIVIGMSDGLTVPFALAAGLTGTSVATTGIVVVAGLAEIAAGSIAMGLGGYLAARTDREHYRSELDREYRETVEMADEEREEVAKVFRGYGMSEQQLEPVVAAIASDRKQWVDFMMRFELGLEEPDPKRARNSAATIAVSYVLGGLVPLAPYMIVGSLASALAAFRGRDFVRPLHFRLRQGPAHRHLSLARRSANRHHRRPRLGRGLRHRPLDLRCVGPQPLLVCAAAYFTARRLPLR